MDTEEAENRKSINELPAATPDWGIKLLEIMQREMHSVALSVGKMETAGRKTNKAMNKIEDTMIKIEECNRVLEDENIQLKEKLLNLE